MTILFSKGSRKRSNRGQTTPVFVVLIVVILMMAGFAVDLADFFLAHQKLKKAADAGALAGAILLKANDPGKEIAEACVESLAGLNFPTVTLWRNASFTATVNAIAVADGSNYEVSVEAQADVMTLFFKLVAIDKMTVKTGAKATSSNSVAQPQPARLVI